MRSLLICTAIFAANAALAEPRAVKTEVLGGFTGPGAEFHPDNLEPVPLRYYGTDLGWTYVHDGELVVLFGDTMETPQGRRAEDQTPRLHDDIYGTVDLGRWSDPASFGPGNLPLVRIGQMPDSEELVMIDPGTAMEGFKTPVAGFSNGTDEYGIFYTGKPQGCRTDEDCANGLSCDTGLGYTGQPFDQGPGQTIACLEGSSPGCVAHTMTDDEGQPVEGSGMCSDPGASVWAEEGFGRVSAVGLRHRIARRHPEERGRYVDIKEWLTSRFLNPALRTVQDYDPARGLAGHDWSVAGDEGDNRKVFLWGRPAFVGVGATNRPSNLYFAWLDMPQGADYEWKPHYFTGLDAAGNPTWSPEENDAAELDLDASTPGVQPDEVHDIVDQVSVAWVEPLGKWVMFYGGGLTTIPYPPYLPTCGVMEFFTGPECTQVVVGNGAFRMRTADHPWGPWSEPQDLIAAGDPKDPTSGQYAPGGVLFHPQCEGEACVARTPSRDVTPEDYGFFYSSIIIPQWTRAVDGGAELIWLASTWNPYRVILMRTRIEP